jgi:hypothetical protein
MLKVKRGRGTQRYFSEISESRHSPLVLVGAPAQGCSSPLIRVRIKCSLRADSSTLRRGESPTTAHTMAWVIHKLHWIITKLPIITEPSRWWRSPRVTSTNSHLTKTRLMRKVDAHFATPYVLIRSLILDSHISITPLGSWSPFLSIVFPQLNKWARELNWTSRVCIYTPPIQNKTLTVQLSTLHGDRTRKSRWPDASGQFSAAIAHRAIREDHCSDLTLSRVRSTLTRRVRSANLLSGPLLMLTEL